MTSLNSLTFLHISLLTSSQIWT